MVHEHIGKLSGRKEDSHKGDYGRVFVIGGSKGFTGAAYLCSQGALRAGSGLVTAGIPESLNTIMEIKLTEAMTLPLSDAGKGSLDLTANDDIIEFAKKCDAVVLGPGIGTKRNTCALVKDLILAIEQPVVLDADGINAIAGKADLLKKRKGRTVVTPHPGEMARLVGKDVESIQKNREGEARDLAAATGAVVCLKGHRTVVAEPGGAVYVNNTGNSGMATGGTGDVLTGMIASFIGQGLDDFSAAVSAVYLHGTAGDIAAEELGAFSMIASDILDYLPDAFNKAGI
jgi:hydroxyethylthiazole kinase-like uncharacterized protein yjeF